VTVREGALDGEGLAGGNKASPARLRRTASMAASGRRRGWRGCGLDLAVFAVGLADE